MSDDGNRVAVGALNPLWIGSANPGYVKVLEYDGSDWEQLGSTILGQTSNDAFSESLELSGDGSHLAVGAFQDNTNGAEAGSVSVFTYKDGDWEQVGDDIVGEDAGDRLGFAVSMSNDGSHLAVGAPGSDDNGTDAGLVQIYEFTGSGWQQKGGDIYGDNTTNAFGTNQPCLLGSDVSISDNGRYVAMGGSAYSRPRSSNGQVRLYTFDGTNWQQLGDDINGEVNFESSGSRNSVSLAGNGVNLAIGSARFHTNGSNSGRVRVYEFPVSWVGPDMGGWSNADNWSNNVVPSVNQNVMIAGDLTVVISNAIAVKSLSLLDGAGIQVDGSLDIANGEDVDLIGPGTRICGSGTVNGNVNQEDGSLCPGSSPGILNIDGDYTNTGGTIEIEIDGAAPGTLYDRIEVTGEVNLDFDATQLKITFGYTPANESFFDVIKANNISGTIDPANITVSGGGPGVSLAAVEYPDGNTLRVIVSAPLPVELTRFTAEEAGGNVQLSWTTASELNNREFLVEHSSDGDRWATLGGVKGSGTTNEVQHYRYLHSTPAVGINYYRLNQVDFDGTFHYSDIRSVIFENSLFLRVFPNPTSGRLQIVGLRQLDPEATFRLMDVNGKVVREQAASENKMDISGLPGGVYLLQVDFYGSPVRFKIVKK